MLLSTLLCAATIVGSHAEFVTVLGPHLITINENAPVANGVEIALDRPVYSFRLGEVGAFSVHVAENPQGAVIEGYASRVNVFATEVPQIPVGVTPVNHFSADIGFPGVYELWGVALSRLNGGPLQASWDIAQIVVYDPVQITTAALSPALLF